MTLFIDLETAGLDYKRNGIVDISYIIEDEHKDYAEVARGTIKINPLYKTSISKRAMEINGYTIEQVKQFDLLDVGIKTLHKILVSSIPDGDKYNVVAYNQDFDKNFLIEAYNLILPRAFGKIMSYKWICPYQVIIWKSHLGLIDLPDHKLQTVCNVLGIPIEAHKSDSDIEATRILYHKLRKLEPKEKLV